MAAGDTAQSALLPRPTESWARWLGLVVLWSVPGLVSSTQVYFLQQRYEPISFATALLWQMPGWLFWVPATPLVLWLGRRFRLDRERRLLSLSVHVLATVALSFPHLIVMLGAGRLVGVDFYQVGGFWVVLTKLFTNHIHLDIVTYWGVLAGGYAINFYRRLRERELVTSQLETRLVRAELEALKGQLHPHFLFNTLNAIAVLIRKQDSAGALRTLTGLSELLRTTLDNAGKQTVALEQELDFLERYLDIQRVRFSDRLEIRRNIDESLLDVHVPNLILQPLVENAVRHGVAARTSGGTIELEATQVADRLQLEVRDDGPGLPDDFDVETTRGVGVSNVRARLQQMYPGEASLEIVSVKGGGTRATIWMPLSRRAFDG